LGGGIGADFFRRGQRQHRRQGGHRLGGSQSGSGQRLHPLGGFNPSDAELSAHRLGRAFELVDFLGGIAALGRDPVELRFQVYRAIQPAPK